MRPTSIASAGNSAASRPGSITSGLRCFLGSLVDQALHRRGGLGADAFPVGKAVLGNTNALLVGRGDGVVKPNSLDEASVTTGALAAKQVPESRFLVIGDGALRPQLEQQARDLGIADRVLFLGTRSDIPQLLALTRALVLSSHMEANPVSILEGLACEKPVVATRVGSIPETVQDGISGYLTPPGDAAQMADRLVQFLRDSELSEAMGIAGRNHVANNWSLARMVSGYQEIIQTSYLSKSLARATSEGGLARSQSAELVKSQ